MIMMTMITMIIMTLMIIIIMIIIVMTCDKGPLLVKVLGDTIQPGQIDDSKTKACREIVIMRE